MGQLRFNKKIEIEGVCQLFVRSCPQKKDIASRAKHALVLPHIDIWV